MKKTEKTKNTLIKEEIEGKKKTEKGNGKTSNLNIILLKQHIYINIYIYINSCTWYVVAYTNN